MENRTHNFIVIPKNNQHHRIAISKLLIKGGEELKVKLPDELEYTTASFCYNLQEGDLTTPCADGSVWRYENNKWARWNKLIEDPVELARINDIKGLRKFISEGGDINIQDKNGWTALMVAIYGGKKEIVELLIKRKADLEIQNQMDETALIASIMLGRIDFAEMLLKGGASMTPYCAEQLVRRSLLGKTKLIQLLIKCKENESARDIVIYFTEKAKREARQEARDEFDTAIPLIVGLLISLFFLIIGILKYYHLL